MADNRFMRRLMGKVPILGKNSINIGPSIFTLLGYQNPMNDSMGHMSKYVECLDEKDGLSNRYFIISKDKNFTRKISVIASNKILKEVEEEDPDDFDLFDDIDDDEPGSVFDANSKILIVNFSLASAEKDMSLAGYNLLQVESVNQAFVSNTDLTGVLFTGLSIPNLDTQLNAVLCCKAKNLYIDLPEEMEDHPSVKNMIYNEDFEVIKSDGFNRDYYLDILNEIADDEKITFDSEELKNDIIYTLLNKCRTNMSEETIASMLNKLCKACGIKGKGKIRREKVEKYVSIDSSKIENRLKTMCGLNGLKNISNEYLALRKEEQNNKKMQVASTNMVFVGNPGTGKTMGAELLAQISATSGINNGIFNVVARKDLIGSYVGHTAPKVSDCFEKSRNGILFVDEAGFFLEKNSGGFINEALKEFVRFMELYKDVTVIFALYPGQVEDFLALDAGLASRISRKVVFDDYSDEELMEICISMLAERGYIIKDNVSEDIKEYFEKVRKTGKDQFGNARESRRIADAIVRMVSIRHFDEKSSGMNVTDTDVKEAIRSMLNEYNMNTGKNSHFGFCC